MRPGKSRLDAPRLAIRNKAPNEMNASPPSRSARAKPSVDLPEPWRPMMKMQGAVALERLLVAMLVLRY